MRRVGVVEHAGSQQTAFAKLVNSILVSTAMPGIAQAAAARAGVARGRGRRRKALTAEEQAERDDYLREASFTAGTFTWSLFFFSAFLLGLASLIRHSFRLLLLPQIEGDCSNVIPASKYSAGFRLLQRSTPWSGQPYVCQLLARFVKICCQIWRARSRLNRNRFWQVNKTMYESIKRRSDPPEKTKCLRETMYT